MACSISSTRNWMEPSSTVRSTTATQPWNSPFPTPTPYSDCYYTFVNGTYTSEGGTHLSAFREGILKGINEFSGKKFVNTDVRDGIVGTLAIKIKDPVFESQTKNKLGNTEIRSWIVNQVREVVSSALYKDTESAQIPA